MTVCCRPVRQTPTWRQRFHWLVRALCGAVVAGMLTLTPAAADEWLCDRAATQVARSETVPLSILTAITRLETGRGRSGRVEPWPWTANVEGQGYWFDSREAALTFLTRQRAAGITNMDIGCFQINWRWHGAAFEDLAAMLDPIQNARYAAQFLARLHDEFGGWERAVGAYHSRTPRFAERYLARYRALRTGPAPGSRETAEVPLAPPEIPRPAAAPRPNPAALPTVRPASDQSLPATPQTAAPANPGSAAPLATAARPPLWVTTTARPLFGAPP